MLVLLIGATLLILCLSKINYRKIYLALKIPGPFPIPILGDALLFYDKTPEGLCYNVHCERYGCTLILNSLNQQTLFG